MHTTENWLGRRIIYYASSCIFKQEFLGQSQRFCTPVHNDILKLGESWRGSEGEVGGLVDNGKHVCEDIGDVDRRRVVAEEFRWLPAESTWKDDRFGHFHEILNFSTFLRCTLSKLVPKESRFDWWQYGSILLIKYFGGTMFDNFYHLPGSFFEGVDWEEFVGHG